MDVKELINKIYEYNPNADFTLIQRAYNFAQKAHEGQLRKSGDPYIEHPLSVAIILAEMKLNSKTIAAGLLHDVVDDGNVSLKELEKEFGEEIAFMVDGVSRLGKIKYRGIEGQAAKLRKMFLAMARDIRVVLIKLADRLHNLETLQYLPEDKQKRIALESIEIYAPLAYRLGMWRMKIRIEDTAFPYAFPQEYKWLMQNVKDKYQERESYLQTVKGILGKELKDADIPVLDLYSRAKPYYSLYKKLQRYDNDLNKIYDLVGLRVITNTVENCYTTLGIVHKLWRPLPGRIKDYIAIPKPNGYQSLHTTVFGPGGKVLEIQIRTKKMHEEAEYGIAAHWYYTESRGLKEYIKKRIWGDSRSVAPKAPLRELSWINQLREWQQETKNPEEFLEGLKIDFFQDRIFVLTPKGDIIDLPKGATGVDFAYAIHTDIGHRCIGIKADNKLIPLSQPLNNAQIVEVITGKYEKPSRDWLRFVKTSQARSKIKKWFKIADEESITQKVTISKPYQPQFSSPKEIDETGKVEIIGSDKKSKIAIHLAKCCQPKPGDNIEGYITVARGISVHRSDCYNMLKLKSRKRLVAVAWRFEKS